MALNHIHILGICGTGVGSLAILLKEAGHKITGSDENVYPPMSTQLEAAGITVFEGYKAKNLAAGGNPDLIIIGNVISRGNPEAEAALASGIKYLSMPQAVAEFFIKGRKSIVACGTHGKTTTSNIAAWMLESLGQTPGFLIGGVGKNFGISARIGKPPYFVVEGDEYDTAFFDKGPKFLHYLPHFVIMGPVEFDHADIYRDLNHVMSSFEKLVAITPKDGVIFACADSPNTLKLAEKAVCKVVTYGNSKDADVHPLNVKADQNCTRFEIAGISGITFTMPMYGSHNLQNTLGVIALLIELGFAPEKIAASLAQFKGVVRRQEIKGEKNGVIVIDDFAHHPTAICETIKAMRTKYPNAKLWAIFEPRSNTSRRKIFQHDFASALASADEAIVANVHRADKLAEHERLNISELIDEINAIGPAKGKTLPNAEEISKFVAQNAKSGDVVLVMSNGGFDNIHQKLLELL